MKTRISIFLTIFVLGLIFAASSELRTKTPEDRVVPETIVLAEKAVLGKVTFNHGNHISKNYNADGTKALSCVDCHHVEQPAVEAAKVPGHKTAYPADRTVTLTAETYKDGTAPDVTDCRICHLAKDGKATILTEVPKSGTTVLNNQNAFHKACTTCHGEVVKARPTVQAPTAMKCVACHKKA